MSYECLEILIQLTEDTRQIHVNPGGIEIVGSAGILLH